MKRRLQQALSPYRAALAGEPLMRAYLGAALVDDLGIAVTAWASALLQTDLFVDQRRRMQLMVPTLICFLVGNVVSGPLADWADGRGAAALARWRWRVVIAGRAVETVALASLVLVVAGGAPTVGRVLPYMMVSAFMKTALRPTRIAFEVDLLAEAAPQLDAAGRPLLDEHGQPRLYKTHLIAFGSISGALQSLAALTGLLLGGALLAAVHHAYWPLFAFDVLTNVVFIAVVVVWCRPAPATAIGSTPPLARVGMIRSFAGSVRDGVRFLFARAQRPILALLAGSWMVELVTESYDGKMIARQVLHATDDEVRRAMIIWYLVGIVPALALPLLTRAVGALGRVFLVLMLVDGLVIAWAGRIAGVPAAGAIGAFALVLGLDHALTVGATTLVDVASNSASSAGMRGRIAATYAFFVLIGDLAMEVGATRWSEAVGLARMLVQIGFVQVALVLVIAAIGGRRLWHFGLHARSSDEGAGALPASAP
jgi:hypothetical protein